VLAPRADDAVEHVAARRDGPQRVAGALPRVGRGLDVQVQAAGENRAAQVEVDVARLPRRLRALARRRRVERRVGEVEARRALPPARSRAGDDLDAWPLAAAVGPERRGIDDDLRDLLRSRQPAFVETVDDEAGYVVLQIAGGIRAGQQQQVARSSSSAGSPSSSPPESVVAVRLDSASMANSPAVSTTSTLSSSPSRARVSASGSRPGTASTVWSTDRNAGADTRIRYEPAGTSMLK
jgi:hypothetical protein